MDLLPQPYLHPDAHDLATRFYTTGNEKYDKATHGPQLGSIVMQRCNMTPEMAASPEAVQRVTSLIVQYGIPRRLIDEWRQDKEAETIEQSLLGEERAVLEAQEQARTLLANFSQELPPYQRGLLAINSLCEEAYKDKPRKSKEALPYYTHPRNVAANSLKGLQELKDQGEDIEDDLIVAAITMGLSHDGVEETKPSILPYDPKEPHKKFTPLVVGEILSQIGNKYAQEVPVSLRRITHEKHLFGPDYEAYIRRGLGYPLLDLAKVGDWRDNLNDPIYIEPNDPERERKELNSTLNETKYLAGLETVKQRALQAISQEENNCINIPWLLQYCEKIFQTTNDQLPAQNKALELFMGLRTA